VARLYFRADAAIAMPEVYEFLEVEGLKYTVRLAADRVLEDKLAQLRTRPVGRLPNEVGRFRLLAAENACQRPDIPAECCRSC
jgi:hypothetical protein